MRPRLPLRLRLAVPAALSIMALTPGCALTSKGDSMQARFFSVDSKSKESARKSASKAMLHLGRVDSSGYLRERLVYREPNGELGFYDELRWSEKPEQYLRRALGRALFEDGGMRQALNAVAPVLDVELLAFEEVRDRGGSPKARVRISAILHDERTVAWQDTVTVEKPIGTSDRTAEKHANEQVRALTEALDEAVVQIGENVIREIDKMPAEGTSTPDSTAAAPDRK